MSVSEKNEITKWRKRFIGATALLIITVVLGLLTRTGIRDNLLYINNKPTPPIAEIKKQFQTSDDINIAANNTTSSAEITAPTFQTPIPEKLIDALKQETIPADPLAPVLNSLSRETDTILSELQPKQQNTHTEVEVEVEPAEQITSVDATTSTIATPTLTKNTSETETVAPNLDPNESANENENVQVALQQNTSTINPTKLAIQIFALSNKQSAIKEIEKLQKLHFDAFYTTSTQTNRTLYLIKVGYFTKKSEALATAKQLKELGYKDTFITQQ